MPWLIGKKQEQIERRDFLDKWDLIKLLSLQSYASGSYTPEEETSIVQIADSQKSFPNFMPITFDGVFWYPVSSYIESSFVLAHQIKYISEANYTRDYEPIHLSRTLTLSGENHAQILEKIPKFFGLEKFDKFVARQLAISSLPIEFAVAMGMYYAASKVPEIQIKLNEYPYSEPSVCYYRTTKDTICQVIEKIKQKDILIKDSVSISSAGNQHFIFYSINKEKIRPRYDYLKIDSEGLKKEIVYFDKINSKEEAQKELLESCCSGLNDKDKKFRSDSISYFLENYKKIPQYYLEEMRSILRLLNENIDEIQKGYESNFKLMEEIAENSVKYPFKTTVTIGKDATSSVLDVRNELKDKIRPLVEGRQRWHYGLNLFVQNVPQFLERIFLTDSSYKQEALENTLITR